MKLRLFCIIAGVTILLGSCKPFQYLTIDLAMPEKEPLSPAVQSLTLINRAVDRRFTDDPADSVQLRFFTAQFDLDSTIYDITSADTLMQTLGLLLFESGRYDIVIPEERFLMKDSLNLYAGMMDWKEVYTVTREFDTDALFSLDFYKTGVDADFSRESFINPEDGSIAHLYHADMKIGYIAQFRLYYPGNKEDIRSYFLTDTLYWYDSWWNITELFRRFPYVKKGLTEAGIDAALSLAEKIAPVWKPSKRAYFAGGSRVLRRTGSMVHDHDWETARGIWLEAAGKKNSASLRSRYEFNIALSYEMQGNLDEAIRWGLKSYETMFRPVTYRYLEILKARKSLLYPRDEKD